MMDTVLNLGLSDASVIGLANVTGDNASPMTHTTFHRHVRTHRARR